MRADDWWADTAVELPLGAAERAWHSQLRSTDLRPRDEPLMLGSLLRALPLAVLAT